MATSTAIDKSLDVKTRGGVRFGKELRGDFLFDGEWLNLNHGSFGTYPRPVQKALREFQDQAEARPDHFIRYIYPKLLDVSKEAVAKILKAPVSTLVFTPNATTGVNTVLRNLKFEPGDHILTFSTIYGACDKTVVYITETTPAEQVKVEYLYPVEDDWLVAEFKRKVEEVKKAGGKVKIAILDTVVSNPGVRVPFQRLIQACKEEGVMSLVDAAHGVGHVELDLPQLDPDFFVSNCHKWLYAPRGCAIFYVPIRNQHLLRSTLPTSHGFVPLPKPGVSYINPVEQVGNKSPWAQNFDYVGTIDSSPYLCVPAAIEFREELGGEEVIRNYNTTLAREAVKIWAEKLGTEVLDNESHTLSDCCMSNVRLPLDYEKLVAMGEQEGVDKTEIILKVRNWMYKKLLDEYHTFVAIFWYGGTWWTRLSGQVYLELEDFEKGASIMKELCERVAKGEFLEKAG
ncbi:PLP-dependent transferase [Corynespora cassiicola Philippines]|uniref:PLP-dependent transferase n=1 Tax=Corynespora cassiicola Philippines TaxID=1448308 RepID=A0A2T2P1D3_CORCC|nr:PLP-dependent transferase [Corynespora cassiicola Philippines]